VADESANAAVSTWLVDEQAWQHSERTGGQVAMLVDLPSVQGGLWRTGRSGLGPVEVDLDHTEVILVLSGSGQLRVDGEEPIALSPGTAARIPAGSHTRWQVSDDYSELWLYV
jgi:uncharacterized cupin superfamily protein